MHAAGQIVATFFVLEKVQCEVVAEGACPPVLPQALLPCSNMQLHSTRRVTLGCCVLHIPLQA